MAQLRCIHSAVVILVLVIVHVCIGPGGRVGGGVVWFMRFSAFTRPVQRCSRGLLEDPLRK